MKKARVFISCSQVKGSDEYELAIEIKKHLIDLGFEDDPPYPYIAVVDQKLKGLVDNIFEKLKESEYFIFIDFKRNCLKIFLWRKYYRGSLFVNQELAVATFLGIPVLGFQEDRIIENDGILKYIHLNLIPFSNRKRLLKLVKNELRKRLDSKEWATDWRRELEIIHIENDVSDKIQDVDPYDVMRIAKYYNLTAINHHKDVIAQNCVIYLEGTTNIVTGEKKEYPLIEYKWDRVMGLAVPIPPQKARKFNAFKITYDAPSVAKLTFNRNIVDYSKVREEFNLAGPGDFKLNFVLYSDNFYPARHSFHLHIGSSVNDIKFKPAGKIGDGPEGATP